MRPMWYHALSSRDPTTKMIASRDNAVAAKGLDLFGREAKQ
jgi:hypothetical protein